MGCGNLKPVKVQVRPCRSVDPTKKIELCVRQLSGELVVTFLADTTWLGIDVKKEIGQLVGAPIGQQQLLVAGTVWEDAKCLDAYGAPEGHDAVEIILILREEWRELALEGQWVPAMHDKWSHRNWIRMVSHRQYDRNNNGFARTADGRKHPRGPYALVQKDPPIWECKIKGPGYNGKEQMKLLSNDVAGDIIECRQERSDVGNALVYYSLDPPRTKKKEME